MIRLLLALALTLFAPSQNGPSYGISYKLAMTHPASHLFEVTIDVSMPPGESTAFVDFQMPMWQPGRYSVADFAKNVQEFNARSQNRALQWDKVDDQTWRVQRQGNRVITATYRVFGNDLSGTYAQLDTGHRESIAFDIGLIATVIGDMHGLPRARRTAERARPEYMPGRGGPRLRSLCRGALARGREGLRLQARHRRRIAARRSFNDGHGAQG